VGDLEITDSQQSRVGAIEVRRALPRQRRRSVGPWCFVDHMGPSPVGPPKEMGVAPHPHIGLQTVTWLIEGKAVHRDSLGTEQVVRPGELNLMTAGHGVSHSEEGTDTYRGTGRSEIALVTREPARVLLFGGLPVDEALVMWWHFVARTREEILEAYRHWMARDDRFGHVSSTLPRIEIGPPPWGR